MNFQEQAGLKIAATRKFTERDGYWLVPQGKNRFLFYRVTFEPKRKECTCQEFERLKPSWCKHLYALKHLLAQQKTVSRPDSKPKPVPKSPAKKSYPRDWSKYNEARREEHAEFKVVLYELCKDLPPHHTSSKGGRPRVPLADLVYAAVTKVRHHKSGAKMESLLKEEREGGRITQIPKASTILNFFNSTKATEVLNQLIGVTCIPFKPLETEFAIDSTFFPIPRKHRWYDEKSGKAKEKLLTFKAHVSSGINTNVVAAIRVTPDRGEDKATADSKQFPFLLEETTQRFRVIEVLADAAYCSDKNFRLAQQAGAVLITRFTSRDKGFAGGPYTDAWFFQRDRPNEHFERYNLRNNVESTHSMMKREYPGKLLFKSDHAIVNEILCIALIHNIDCLIAAKYVLGIDVGLRSEGK